MATNDDKVDTYPVSFDDGYKSPMAKYRHSPEENATKFLMPRTTGSVCGSLRISIVGLAADLLKIMESSDNYGPHGDWVKH